MISRRRVLAAVAAGGAGALVGTGAGTRATFSDEERFGASLTAGTVDLTIAYEILTGPGADGPASSGTTDGPRVRLPVGALGNDATAGSTLLTFSLPQRPGTINNPAALWLAADCPTPEATGLAEAIQLQLSYADCDTGTPLDTVADGSLREVATALDAGLRIDGDPTTSDTDCLTDSVCLLAEYELGGYVGSETVDLPLWSAAVQCRNTTPSNPFSGRATGPCPPGEICTCCRTLGKLELDQNTVDPGTYAFTEGSSDYGLEIYDTATTDEGTIGVAFRLVALAGGVVPSLCTVAVKGGPGFEQYDRDNGTIVDSADLPGSDDDGLVYAPEGTGISHVTVCVCTPEPEAECAGCTDPSITNSNRGGPNGSGGKGSNGGSGGTDSDGGSGGRGGEGSNGGPDAGPSGRGGPPAASPGGDQ
ncbi:hypothetical protein [Halobellus ruber]|uniref:SipW-cognate class signal peptide n=1 Tax=Halobellus ruber TaxID=2761102 RepID=A0A7J9SNE6_9EURY|nr:hypothetical protein [Halobellus ruber]MBB6647627.1 hypothetical protein [Halobellus ruber]